MLSANPLSISSAISFQDSVSNFWFERNFLESLFSAQMDWTEPSLKEADVNLSKVQPTPHRFECPAYFNIWLFDISTIVLIIFTTIVCIFTSVFNAMRQLLGQSHCPGLPMGLPIPQINCPLPRSLLPKCSNTQIHKNTNTKIHKCTNTQTNTKIHPHGLAELDKIEQLRFKRWKNF